MLKDRINSKLTEIVLDGNLLKENMKEIVHRVKTANIPKGPQITVQKEVPSDSDSSLENKEQ